MPEFRAAALKRIHNEHRWQRPVSQIQPPGKTSATTFAGRFLETANQLEADGHRILKLNIGNPASFGFEAPDEIIQDVIRNLPQAQGYCESKGLFAARKAVMQYCQQLQIPDVEVDDVYMGNGVSEMVMMALQGLLEFGDEILIPAPDFPLWTAAVNLSGGRPVHYLCDEGSGLVSGSRRHSFQDHAAHPRYRRHQPQQPDRRGVLKGSARADRRNRSRTSAGAVCR